MREDGSSSSAPDRIPEPIMRMMQAMIRRESEYEKNS